MNVAPSKNIPWELLDKDEEKALKEMLSSCSKSWPTLYEMWGLMDKAWEKYGCDNRTQNMELYGKFYSDPVWLLNGFFGEFDSESYSHRHAIAMWLDQQLPHNARVADYGGGFGTLARLLADRRPDLEVQIFEPHPSRVAKKLCEPYNNISFVSQLTSNYSAITCIDVLEHLKLPIKVCQDSLIPAVKPDGLLVFVNCFYPVIQCHLPENFHFRFSFNKIMEELGLGEQDIIPGSFATAFKKLEAPCETNQKSLDLIIDRSRKRYAVNRLGEWIGRCTGKLKRVLKP